MEFTRPIRQPKTTHTRHRNGRLTVLLPASNKRRHSCPGHWCFEKFISHQLGLRRPKLPKLRHLLTKLRQRQQTPLAIIRCFLDFSSPHTPAFTPGSHHPAAPTPAEWQTAPAIRVTLLLPGGQYHQDPECLKSIARTGFKAAPFVSKHHQDPECLKSIARTGFKAAPFVSKR